MDRSKVGVWIEVIRGVAGIVWLGSTGDWFGINTYLPLGYLLVGTYFLMTILGGIYFTLIEKEVDKDKLISI